jgi:hypothetical protein
LWILFGVSSIYVSQAFILHSPLTYFEFLKEASVVLLAETSLFRRSCHTPHISLPFKGLHYSSVSRESVVIILSTICEAFDIQTNHRSLSTCISFNIFTDNLWWAVPSTELGSTKQRSDLKPHPKLLFIVRCIISLPKQWSTLHKDKSYCHEYNKMSSLTLNSKVR